MRLINAIKITTIDIGSEVFTLRPSLRCAYLLATREGGFEKLLKDLSEQSITAMTDVIAAALDDAAAREFSIAVSARPLRVLLDMDAQFDLEPLAPPQPVNEKLIAFILATLDINTENRTVAPGGTATRSKQDFTGLLEQLYSIGTGWLGWTPEDTWAAAPVEIVAAHKGRLAMLKAIFGSGKNDAEDDENTPKEPDFTRDPDAGAKLRTLKAVGF